MIRIMNEIVIVVENLVEAEASFPTTNLPMKIEQEAEGSQGQIVVFEGHPSQGLTNQNDRGSPHADKNHKQF